MEAVNVLVGMIGFGPVNNFGYPVASLLVVYKVAAIDIPKSE